MTKYEPHASKSRERERGEREREREREMKNSVGLNESLGLEDVIRMMMRQIQVMRRTISGEGG